MFMLVRKIEKSDY